MAISKVYLYTNGGVINFSGVASAETNVTLTKPLIAPNPSEEFTAFTGSGWTMVEHTDTTITRDGYVFSEWNSSADGTGTSFAIGDTFKIGTIYAIWSVAPQQSSEALISLGNTTITTITDSGTEVLETIGKFLTDDITVDFTQGGNATVTVSLGNTTVTTMSSTSTEVLETSGTFLTDDITITLA